VSGYGLRLSESGYGPLTECSCNGNKPAVSIRSGGFPEHKRQMASQTRIWSFKTSNSL